MPRFAIIDAPSILGLRPTGVEHLPDALKAAGLMEKLQIEDTTIKSGPLKGLGSFTRKLTPEEKEAEKAVFERLVK